MAYELDQKILESESDNRSPNEEENLEVLQAVLRRKAGSKDQRNAILRVIKQVGPTVIDRNARNNIKKAITKISTDYKLPNLA